MIFWVYALTSSNTRDVCHSQELLKFHASSYVIHGGYGLSSIYEINGFSQFYELKHEWDQVLQRSKDKNIFLTWEYLSTYWKHFGKGKTLTILCIEDKGKIIAIAPLRQSRYNFAGKLGYNVIEPLGYRGLVPEGADYTGLLLGEREEDCFKLILNYLVEHNGWDFIYLMDVPQTSVIPGLIAKVSKTVPFEIEEGSVCPYISLPDSMDIFLKELSRKFRKELGRCMRNLEKDYHKVKLKRYNEIGPVEEAMKIHFELNQKRWKSKNMLGTFNTQEVRNFYIDVAKLFADNGWLALYFLTVNDEPIAGLYSFEYDQKMLAAVSGFDPDYSRYSVGNLLFAKVIEKCIERKMKEFDFMKGDEPYKFGWTKTYRRNLGIRFVNRRLTSNLYRWGIRMVKQTKMVKLFKIS